MLYNILKTHNHPTVLETLKGSQLHNGRAMNNGRGEAGLLREESHFNGIHVTNHVTFQRMTRQYGSRNLNKG